MTCRVFADLIADYLSADLELESRRDFERHHGTCRKCQIYLRSYEATLTLARHAFDDDTQVPQTVRKKVTRAVLRVRLKPTDQ